MGMDYALAKRIYLIPFTLSFVNDPKQPFERKADEKLLRKLRAESPGILAWLVQGCLEYQRVGLQPPNIVLAATQQYMDSEDVILQFIQDRCTKGDALLAPAGKAWAAWTEWCGEQGRRTWKQQTFKERMEAHGFEHVRGQGGAHFYRGIELLPTLDPNSNLPYFPGAE